MIHENYHISIIQRILSRSIRRDNGCIEYQGNPRHKYGLISITIDSKRQLHPAHRALYVAAKQQWGLPGKIQVRHKCDNTRCVNIDHLEPGTSKDNYNDMIQRGRRAKHYKMHTRHRVHDDDKIRSIRQAEGKYKYIAEMYGVSVGYVSKIRLRKAKELL